jgi:hypothetical protein
MKFVSRLARRPDAGDERLLASLLQAGVNLRTAKRLVVLVPSAFGRDVVSRLGVRLDPNVEILREDGSDRTIRRLDSFLEFKVAVSLIPRIRETTAFKSLAAHSSEVNAVEAIRVKTGRNNVQGAQLTAVLVTWDIV